MRNRLVALVEESSSQHSSLWQETFLNLQTELLSLDERVKHYDQRIKEVARTNEICKRLLKRSGVGEITATATYAAVGNGSQFKNGRNFAAWVGLTPKEYSTGGKSKLGSISKRGNKYLRKMLVQGARSVAVAVEGKRSHKRPEKRVLNQTERWLFEVAGRRGANRAVIALANKTARRMWYVLQGEDFMQPEQLAAKAAQK